jgi:plastocyanin
MGKCDLQRFCSLSLLVPAALFLTACANSPSATGSRVPADAALPLAQVDPATVGTITGKVLFTGDPPVMPVIDMASNPNCEKQHKTPQKAETVIVNPNGTLKYAFVWIKDGLPKARWNPPAEAARLDQTGCVYGPHLLGIMEGQQLEILNNDPVNHNVHAESQINPAWNESQPPRAEHKFKRFNAAEIMFPMTCSVHPWMRSWVAVSPHPFFAVTGDDGSFKLNGVPPGTYTIEAVHERFGRKEGKLTLAPSGTATLDFSYGS